MACDPPGCTEIHFVRSYTLPLIALQQLACELCAATSVMVYVFVVVPVVVVVVVVLSPLVVSDDIDPVLDVARTAIATTTATSAPIAMFVDFFTDTL